MNSNETETKRDNLDKVIEECPNETSVGMMEDCGNEDLYDSNQNNLNEEN